MENLNRKEKGSERLWKNHMQRLKNDHGQWEAVRKQSSLKHNINVRK